MTRNLKLMKRLFLEVSFTIFEVELTTVTETVESETLAKGALLYSLFRGQPQEDFVHC